MSLYVFSTFVLSLVFMLVMGSWWNGSAPFKVHLAALAVVCATMLCITLLIALYPVLASRSRFGRRISKEDKAAWGIDVSNKLSTPAAVLDGYNVVFANKAFLNELGMSGMSDQVIGMPLTNLVHPSDHQNIAKLFARGSADETDQSFTIKLRILSADGTSIPVFAAISPLSTTDNPEFNLLQLSPTTAVKHTFTSTPDLFDYHLLVEQIEQIVFQLNTAREIIFLNPSWERLLDHKLEGSLNKSLLAYIHPEDKPMVDARLNSLTLGRRNHCLLETRLIGRNGDSRWVELRARNISGNPGELSSVIGTLTDISRMKQTEASLRANRRSLSMLLSNVPGMVYRCKNDKNWTFEFVSDGSLDVTGYEPYEMVNNPNFAYTQIIHPDDRARTWDLCQRQVAKQERFQFIYRITTRSGQVKYVWEQGKGVFSSTGDLLALEGFITDLASHDNEDGMLDIRQIV
ncbi:histidine kinase [Novimethylophilus kurashikiensis]|uniref:histidine kinase n=1 Tax=Novimethylophilus kurashikiensis TaxID=1825523 RepID=A0A2R5F4Y4_9PROT|nr:PAS domain-containing protein [Novimethylophilus kurashikiensis]GBG13427.1 histidine kinase [Novimethylophilus kurashikiensis]